MSDAEHMSRKELLQPNRMEKKLYAFVDHAYRKKRLYIGAGVAVITLIIGIWGGWQFVQSQRVNQANLFHIARAKLSNPALSEQERFSQGIAALQEFAKSESSSVLSVLALMESGEAYARQSKNEEAIPVFEDVIKHPEATIFLRNAARLSLSALFEELQRWDEAEMMIEGIDISSWDDVRWRALARIAILKGESEQAKKLLEKLLETVPESVFRQEAETLLLTL
ncbi:MAG: tetratricopeptide repeat protein [SAR324 cluster bacterium]|nr:tetratricopeptide repeat protein [SAR324 cluster bacterium]MBL7036104.1 tetratricopeptide repeat protein [SAR324 cluster bacterium]